MTNLLQRLAIFLCVAIVMGAIPWTEGSRAQAIEMGGEKCTLNSVTVTVSGDTVTFENGLKPYPVDAEEDWVSFLGSVVLRDWIILESDACTSGIHDRVRGRINLAGSNAEKEDDWYILTGARKNDEYYYNNMSSGGYMEEQIISANSLYYDVHFQFVRGVDEETPEGITVRFARSYDISYQLAGGAFGEETLDSYTAGAQYTLPTPTRDGYSFEGWTGTGLSTPTKEVVLPIGSTGDRSYTATWKEIESSQEPGGESADTPEVGDKVSDKDKKATYKVTKITGSSLEVTYVAPKKKTKSVTIPATITLADGVKAKVTAIAANAFKGNNKLQTVTIGKNVKTIGKNAFSGCSKLTKVTIGKNVTTIGTKAFYNCKKLKTIKINTTKLTLKKVGTKAFKGIHSKAKITVPSKKLKSYKTILIKRGIGKNVTVKKQK